MWPHLVGWTNLGHVTQVGRIDQPGSCEQREFITWHMSQIVTVTMGASQGDRSHDCSHKLSLSPWEPPRVTDHMTIVTDCHSHYGRLPRWQSPDWVTDLWPSHLPVTMWLILCHVTMGGSQGDSHLTMVTHHHTKVAFQHLLCLLNTVYSVCSTI